MNWLGFLVELFLQIPSIAQMLLSYIGLRYPLLSSSTSSPSFNPLPVVEIPLQETPPIAAAQVSVHADVSDAGSADDHPIQKLTVSVSFQVFQS